MQEKKAINKKCPVPARKPTSKRAGNKTWTGLKEAWHYLWMFRGVIVSLPVLVLAIGQAFRNATILPEQVGLSLQATGEFSKLVPRSTAVVVPLLITMGCILLTCFTKRPLFPWLISLFSLVIPVLIWVINLYPA